MLRNIPAFDSMKIVACDVDHGLGNWERNEAQTAMNIGNKKMTPEIRSMDLDVDGINPRFPFPENGQLEPHLFDKAATLVFELAMGDARGSKENTWKSPFFTLAKKHSWPSSYTKQDIAKLKYLRRLPSRLVESRRRVRTGLWDLLFIYATPRRLCNRRNKCLMSRLRVVRAFRAF